MCSSDLSMFDTIVPSIGSKYDLGITAMTITEERLQSVDFVSYYRAGSTWAVQKGNPKKLDTSDMCGAKIAVQTGTVQEDEANKIAKGCKADKKAEVMSYKRQAEAATAVVNIFCDIGFSFFCSTSACAFLNSSIRFNSSSASSNPICVYTFIVTDISECPMRYCNVFGFIPDFAILEQYVCRHT